MLHNRSHAFSTTTQANMESHIEPAFPDNPATPELTPFVLPKKDGGELSYITKRQLNSAIAEEYLDVDLAMRHINEGATLETKFGFYRKAGVPIADRKPSYHEPPEHKQAIRSAQRTAKEARIKEATEREANARRIAASNAAFAKAAGWIALVVGSVVALYAFAQPLMHMALILIELIAGAITNIASSMSLMGWLIVVVIFGFSRIISAINRAALVSSASVQAILKKMEEQRQAEEEQRQAEIDDNPKFTLEIWQTITRMIAEDDARLAELTAAGVTSGEEFTALSERVKNRKTQKITEQEFLLKAIANRN
jgi:hypothetical protein